MSAAKAIPSWHAARQGDHDISTLACVLLRETTMAKVFALVAAGIALTGCGEPSLGAKVEPLGTIAQSPTIQGRDGGSSGLVFGRSVWSFGDTVLDAPDAAGVNWHQNSWSFTDDLVATDGIRGLTERTDAAGAPTYFIAPTPDEAAYDAEHYGNPCAQDPCGARWAAWPGPPIWDQAGGRALVFYGLVHAAPGDFNFYGVGQGVAVWSDFSAAPERPVVSPGADHPTLLFGQGEPPWGTAALVDGDTLYVFACESDASGLSPPCSLARVPAAKVLDRGAWDYYDGSAWSTSMADRIPLFTGAPTVSVQHNAYLAAYTAAYAEPLSNRVVLRVAPALIGPWSDPEVLFTADKPDGNAYDAASHAEYQEQGGKVLYFTFSRSSGQGLFGSELALVRVTLP
jgi:hypothetical protein